MLVVPAFIWKLQKLNALMGSPLRMFANRHILKANFCLEAAGFACGGWARQADR
jgi:hypothetical protein